MLERVKRGIGRHGFMMGAIRLLDHWLTPYGISPLNLIGRGSDNGPAQQVGARELFDDIARKGTWGSAESISGPGSEFCGVSN